MPQPNTTTDFSFLADLGVKVTINAPLNQCTTFKLGGCCTALVECTDAGNLCETVKRLRTRNKPFLLMGFGSNILASDQGINKIILRYSSATPILRRDKNAITADAATQLDTLANYSVEQGLDGLTAMIGIPGTVGGAITGNAGAYGQQISDHLSCVTVLRPDNSVVTLKNEDIIFSYRDSEFKHNGDIILTAEFALTACPDSTLYAKREEVLRERKFKLNFWQECPCAGSFFRNVEPTSKAGQRQAAGWYLEQAGAKGLELDGARIYEKHANIITRKDGTKAQSVYELSLKMAAVVKSRFNIDLVREVRLLGEFKGAANCNAAGYW